MTKITYGEPRLIDIKSLAQELSSDLYYDDSGWDLYEVLSYKGDFVHSHSLQIVFSAKDQRAGILLVGSGSSGHTSWTDASSPKDALRRYIEDDMQN